MNNVTKYKCQLLTGAMEHWGLVTFRETALLYDSGNSSTANKQRVATVIAHEVRLCHNTDNNPILITKKIKFFFLPS